MNYVQAYWSVVFTVGCILWLLFFIIHDWNLPTIIGMVLLVLLAGGQVWLARRWIKPSREIG